MLLKIKNLFKKVIICNIIVSMLLPNLSFLGMNIAQASVSEGKFYSYECPYNIKFAKVSTGYDSTLAIDTDGNLWGWGDNKYGQLGNGQSGKYASEFAPIQIKKGTKFTEIAISDASFAIDTDGNLWTWGIGKNSGTGIENDDNYIDNHVLIKTPVIVKQGTKFSKVKSFGMLSGEVETVLAIDTYGNLWGWGNNNKGQLGNGNTTFQTRPIQIMSGTKFKDMAVGRQSIYAIDASGNLWACGHNSDGQIGNNTTTDTTSFVQVKSGTKFQKVAASCESVLAIDSNYNLWGWGDNSYSNLGNGGIGNDKHYYNDTNYYNIQTVPTQIKSGTKFKEITMGSYNGYAIDTSDNLWAWGSNEYGQVGNNKVSNSTSTDYRKIAIQSTPVQIGDGKKFTSVSSYYTGVLAIDSTSGHTWVWGNNVNSCLGAGSASDRYVPYAITGDYYNVTLETNGGKITSGREVTEYPKGKAVDLPSSKYITKANYTFGGWYTNSSFTGTAVTQISATETGDKTYYAKWIPNTYTVTLNTNDGKINSGDISSYTYGIGATLPTNVTKSGYRFDGWYTSSTFSGTPVTKITTTDSGNKTYYAKWVQDNYTYSVEYYYDGVKDNSKTESFEASLGSSINDYTKKLITGYKLSKTENLPLTITSNTGNNVIRVYYITDSSQTKNLSYTVEYYKDNVKVDSDTQTVNNTVQVLQPDTLTVNKTQINTTNKYLGYKLDKTQPTTIPTTVNNGDVIKVYYVLDANQTKNLSYTVEYYKDNVKVDSDTQTVNNTVQVLQPDTLAVDKTQINTTNKYEGYKLDKTQPTTIPTTVNSGDIIKVYYIKRTDLSYKVNYLEEGTNNVLHEQKIANNQSFGTVITSSDEAIEIEGYNYAYPDKTELLIGTSENVINIYYTKVTGLSYTVNFLEKGTNEILFSPDIQGDNTFGDVITSSSRVIEIDGYNFDSVDKNELVIGTGENVINIYYTKRSDLSYEVNYLEKNTNKVLKAKKTVNNQTFKNVIDTATEKVEIDGYDFDSVNTNELTIGTNGNVINIYYYKRADLNYKVNYLEKGTNQVIKEQKIAGNQIFESVINTADEVINIDGYIYNSIDLNSLTITTGDNVINIYYTKRNDLSYIVNYLEKGTNNILNTRTENNVAFQTTINSASEVIPITGYNYDSVDKDTLVIGTSENVINIYYTKRSDLSYTINYLEKDTGRIMHEKKIAENQEFATVIKASDEVINIDGYSCDSVDKNELVIGIGENVINIYYVKRMDLTYKINYLEKDTKEVIYERKIVENQVFESEINTANAIISIDGFDFDSIDKETLKIGTGENVVNIYYLRRTDLAYRVNYLEKDTNSVLHDYKEEGSIAFGTEIETINEIIEIDGYDYDSRDKEILKVGTGENIINIYYTKRKNLSYKVNYLEKDTNQKIRESEIINDITFGTIINTNNKVIEIDGYNYDSVDKNELIIGTNENVINIYYTKKTNLSYKVSYLEEVTNRILHEEKIVNNQTFGSVIKASDEAIAINGYNYAYADKTELVIEDKENIINIYYNKVDGLGYCVNFLEKDSNKQLFPSNEQGNKKFEDVIKTSDEIIEIEGYRYSYADKDELVIGTNENIINIYYEKRNDLSYIVNYLEEETNLVLHDPKVVENAVFGEEIQTVNEIIEIDGYNVSSRDKEILKIATGKNIINIYYTKKTDLSYTINYLEKDTNEILHEEKVVENQLFGSRIEIANEIIEINGYNYDSSNKNEIVIGTGENVVNLYYTKKNNLNYKVNYLEKETGKVLHKPKEIHNQSFGTIVNSIDEVIAIDGYNYDSVDKGQLTIGTSENIINIYYIKRTDLSYKVNYVEKGTNVLFHTSKIVGNQMFESVINSIDEVIEIDGYNYDSSDKENITIGTNENVINLYYIKKADLSYTVNYLEKGTNEVLNEQKIVNGQTFESIINTLDEVIDINGYSYDSSDKESIIIGINENVINLYYIKKSDLSYKVNYLEKGTNKVLTEQKIVNGQTFESIINVLDEVININGYNYDSSDKDQLVIGTGENVINIYYIKVEGLSYTVKYIEKGTERVLHAPKTKENQAFGDEIQSNDEAIEIDGFKYDSANKEKLIIGMDLNEIIIYYTKRNDLSYKVHYVDEDTGEEIIPEKEVPNNTFEDIIDGKDDIEEIDGYVPIGPEGEIEIGTKDNDIIIIYKKRNDLSYRVNYLEKDTDKVIYKQKIVDGVTFKDIIISENEIIDIDGYKFDSVDKDKLVIQTENNVINIYYKNVKTQVIVHYYEEKTNNKLSENVIIEGIIGDDYTTTEAISIPSKYELVQEPENKNGVMTENTIEVIYYYRLKDTFLTIKYLEKDTKEELANSETQTGKIDEDYITDAKLIEGYTLVEDSGNKTGKLTEEPIVVIFYYLKNTSVEVNHIDKNTEEILDSYSKDGLVGDEYTSNSKNFDGYALVEKPESETVVMTKDKIILNYYYAHVSAGVIEKHIDIISNEVIENTVHEGNEGDSYNIPSKEFTDYDLVEEKLPTNNEGKMTKDPIEVIYYYQYRTKVTAEYIDKLTGEKIIEDVIQVGHETDEYKTEKKEFENYVLVETPENEEGKMTKEPIIVKYYYVRKSAGVKIKYIDDVTNKVLKEEQLEGNEGDSFKTEPISIPGYDIVTEKLPENPDGKMTTEEIIVNYYYIKQSSVTVKYIDKTTGDEIVPGEEIKGHQGDKYETKEKEIEEYKLVDVPENKEGTMGENPVEVIYSYVRSAEIIINFIDVDTDKKIVESVKILGYEGDDYQTESKDIKYYKLVEEKSPANSTGKMKAGTTNLNYYYRKLKFSLKIDKIIEDVTLNGNTLKVNGDLGKLEIYRKDLANAKVQIRYKIIVKNDGELVGKVKLLEKIPSGTIMSKENNSNWKISDTTATLETEEIRVGETKEYIVVLDWINSESNIGTKSNTVEVLDTENEAGFDYKNIDIKGDSAELIIAVSTGSDKHILRVLADLVVLISISVSIILIKKYTKQ